MVTFKDIDRTDITGFLGNNLFQISVAYNLAVENNEKLILPHFEFENIFENPFFETLDKNELIKNIEFEYNEPHFQYKKIPYESNMNLNGYFQSPKYFNEVITKKNFKIKTEIKNQILNTVNSQLDKTYEEIFAYHKVTSLHVRRGDFLTFSHVFANLFEGDYYKKAIERLYSETDYFLIFSNDIPFCKGQFSGSKFIFSETEQEKSQGNKSAVHDLFLGSYCKNNIIANSTFSWWQGYLNDSPYKKVLYPQNWFRPGLHDVSELFPINKNWILI